MFLSKSVILFFVLVIQYCYCDEECTLSDIILHRYKKGIYNFYSGQRLIKNNSTRFSRTDFYAVTELAYYNYCVGFTTETLDTVILDCPEQSQEKTNCFKILTPKFDPQNNNVSFVGKEERLCVSKLDESCIGLKIQDNLTITLECDFDRQYYYPGYRGGPYQSQYIGAQESMARPGQIDNPRVGGPYA